MSLQKRIVYLTARSLVSWQTPAVPLLTSPWPKTEQRGWWYRGLAITMGHGFAWAVFALELPIGLAETFCQVCLLVWQHYLPNPTFPLRFLLQVLTSNKTSGLLTLSQHLLLGNFSLYHLCKGLDSIDTFSSLTNSFEDSGYHPWNFSVNQGTKDFTSVTLN